MRRPKRYLVDAALVTAALGLDEQGVLADGDMLGRVLDTFVAAQLRPELAIARSRPRLFHVRTEEGRHEIDLVAEVRAGTRHLAWLAHHLGERFLAGVVLHTGPHVYRLSEKIIAAPIAVLWS